MKGITLPHNGYLYFLVTRGIPGLLLFLVLMVLPIVMFYRSARNGDTAAVQSVLWIVFFGVVSLTQTSVFARGHYLSFFLVGLVLLMATAINDQAKARETGASDG